MKITILTQSDPFYDDLGFELICQLNHFQIIPKSRSLMAEDEISIPLFGEGS